MENDKIEFENGEQLSSFIEMSKLQYILLELSKASKDAHAEADRLQRFMSAKSSPDDTDDPEKAKERAMLLRDNLLEELNDLTETIDMLDKWASEDLDVLSGDVEEIK